MVYALLPDHGREATRTAMSEPGNTDPHSHPVDDELDVTGLVCPLPVLRTRKRMNSLAQGQRLRVLATDPASYIDIRHYAETNGHTLLDSRKDDNVFIYVLQHGG